MSIAFNSLQNFIYYFIIPHTPKMILTASYKYLLEEKVR